MEQGTNVARWIAKLSCCLIFTAQLAQAQVEEIDVLADDLLAGEADTSLVEIGARAAQQGLDVAVTAPSYWREMIEEPLREGGGQELPISFRENIIESVIIRLRPGSAGQAVPAPTQAEPEDQGPAPLAPDAPEIDRENSRVAAQGSLRDQAAEHLGRGAHGSEPAAAVPTLRPTITVTDPASVLGTVAEGSATPAPLEAGRSEANAEEVGESGRDDAADQDEMVGSAETSPRQYMQELLNEGKEISRSLTIGQLRVGDEIFRGRGLVAAMRPSKAGRRVYWVEGELDFSRDELRRVGRGRYIVERRMLSDSEGEQDEVAQEVEPQQEDDAEESSDRPEFAETAYEAERADMERRYNQGRPIVTTISVAALRPEDRIYVGDNLKVVVRRDRVALRRYWLTGDVDFEREEFERLGSRRYRVMRTIR